MNVQWSSCGSSQVHRDRTIEESKRSRAFGLVGSFTDRELVSARSCRQHQLPPKGYPFPPPSAWIPSRASLSHTRPSQRPANVSSPPGNRPVTPFLQSTRRNAGMERNLRGGLRKTEAASCGEHTRKQVKVNLEGTKFLSLPPQIELLSAGS